MSNSANPSVDLDRFKDLFDQYKNLVFKVAFLILGDKQEAEDALQEVFIQVYRSLHTYNPQKGAFTTWLYRITVNQSIKRKRKQRVIVVPLDNLSTTISPLSVPGMDEIADSDEIREAIKRLNDHQRTVLILRYFSGLSYEEISRILEIPIGTVKSRLVRAIKTLQRELSDSHFTGSSEKE